MIRVLLADDHQIVIDGLRLMLAAEPDIECVAEANDGEAALLAFAETRIDVAVVDIAMPRRNGIELTRALADGYPEARVIGLSMLQEVSLVRAMLAAGATGFLPKNAGRDEVLAAIRAVAAGRRYLSPAIEELLGAPRSGRDPTVLMPLLSRREKQVLRLILAERTTAEIAEALHVSRGTAETHRRNMLSKLGVRNTAGLVRCALEYNLLDAEGPA